MDQVKFRRHELRPAVIAEVEEKLRRIVKPRHTSIFPVLIHVNVVSPKVEASGFFSRVIDFADALRAP